MIKDWWMEIGSYWLIKKWEVRFIDDDTFKDMKNIYPMYFQIVPDPNTVTWMRLKRWWIIIAILSLAVAIITLVVS